MSRRGAMLLGLLGAGAGYAISRRRRAIDLEGRVAVVTGGSRGLGMLVAREMLQRGCRVAICAREGEELTRAAAILAEDGDVFAVGADITLPDDVASLFRRVDELWGPVDILVNNAGIIEVGPSSTMSVDDFRRVMEVNFWGMVNMIQEAVPSMRKQGFGRIANITSIGGRMSVPHLLPYGCAKFAAVGLSEGLHAELARDWIVVTTVVPGLMRTGSPVHAEFRGRPEEEYAWFSVASSSPLMSMDARRAARRIVRAIERGEAVTTLSWQAKLATRVHGVAPGTVSRMLGAVNRFLPVQEDGAPARGPIRGGTLEVPTSVARLTRRMRRAAMRNNEVVTVEG